MRNRGNRHTEKFPLFADIMPCVMGVLDALPGELLCLIYHSIGGYRRVTLKALRLVSRQCANLVTEKLFTTIFVYMLNDRWSALNNIASSPKLACFVKKIELCNDPTAGRCLSFQQWYEHNERKTGLVRRPADPLPQGVGSTVATSYNTSRTCEEAHLLHRRWICDKFNMECNLIGEHAPELFLRRLPNLEFVETIDYRRQFQLRWSFGTDLTDAVCTRRELATGLTYTSPEIENAHLPLFMIACQRCDFHLKTLHISHSSELLADRSFRGASLTVLQHLRIGCAAGEPCYTVNRYGPMSLAVWVRTLGNLQTFKVLRSYAVEDDVDFFAMLRGVCWPNLKRVKLSEVTTCEANLQQFLLHMFHQKILEFEELIVWLPLITEGDWQRLKKCLECMNPKPRTLLLGWHGGSRNEERGTGLTREEKSFLLNCLGELGCVGDSRAASW
jgi:hypothetical protein